MDGKAGTVDGVFYSSQSTKVESSSVLSFQFAVRFSLKGSLTGSGCLLSFEYFLQSNLESNR